MTEPERKQSNLMLILAVIIAILLTSLIWWFLIKPSKPIETKGSFPAITVKSSEIKPLPELRFVHDGFKTIIDSSEVLKFQQLYNITKSEYDSLLVANAVLDSMAQATNDLYYQQLYNNCKSIEFSHVFDNDTIKVTFSGISRGAPERVKLDWELKLPKPKETVFALWTGVETGMTKSFKNFNAKINLDFQFGKKLMVKTAFDTDTRIYLGLSTNLFTIKK